MTNYELIERKYRRIKYITGVMLTSVSGSRLSNILEVPEYGDRVLSCDISEGGICLNLLDCPTPTEIVKVSFKINHIPVEAYARLVWNVRNVAGLQYIVFADEDHQVTRRVVNRRLAYERRRKSVRVQKTPEYGRK